MAELKLAKLPDRKPVKVAVSLSPELHRALNEYADAYEATYGQRETLADIIPFILTTFIEGDRAFSRSRQKQSS